MSKITRYQLSAASKRNDPYAFDLSYATSLYSLDVSTEEINPYGITLNPNGSQMFVCGFQLEEINTYTLSQADILSSASHAQVNTVGVNPYGLDFNEDGTQLFVARGGTTTNEYYTLSTAYDVSTATLDSTIATTAFGPCREFRLPQNDYNYMYTLNATDEIQKVFRYMYDPQPSNTTNNDLVHSRFVDSGNKLASGGRNSRLAVNTLSSYSFASASVASYDPTETTQRGALAFLPNGNVSFGVYFSTYAYPRVNEYGTPYDVTTLTNDANRDVTSATTGTTNSAQIILPDEPSASPYAAYFNYDALTPSGTYEYLRIGPDLKAATGVSTFARITGMFIGDSGYKFYAYDEGADDIHEFNLTYQDSLEDMTYVRSVALSPANLDFIAFSGDGMKLYGSNGSYLLYQWPLTTAWDLSSLGSSSSKNIGGTGLDIAGLEWDTGGYYFTILDDATDTLIEYETDTQWDIAGGTVTATGNSYAFTNPTTSYRFRFSSDGLSAYIVGNDDNIYEYTLSSAFNVGSTVTYNGFFETLNSYTNFAGSTILPVFGGYTMYVSDRNHNAIQTFQFDTQYDITTMKEGASIPSTFEPNLQDDFVAPIKTNKKVTISGAHTLCVADNGNRMYYAIDETVYQTSLTDPYDITNYTAVGNKALFDSNQTANYRTIIGLSFNATGTKMIVSTYFSPTVVEFDLTTAWDITTATYNPTTNNVPEVLIAKEEASFTAKDTDVRGFDISPDGRNLIIVGTSTDDVHRYTMATPFDITNATFSETLDLGTTNIYNDVKYSHDGKYLFVANDTTNEIVQYKIGER